jgi:hypothetical protein
MSEQSDLMDSDWPVGDPTFDVAFSPLKPNFRKSSESPAIFPNPYFSDF